MGKKGLVRKTPAKHKILTPRSDILPFLSVVSSTASQCELPSSPGDLLEMSAPASPASDSTPPALTHKDVGEILRRLDSIPTKHDLQQLEHRLLEQLHTQTLSLQTEVSHATSRLVSMETVQEEHAGSIAQLHSVVAEQSQAIADVQSHLEDLDNRGRRNNLRVRGIPEEITPHNIEATLTKVFNDILEAHPDNVILFDRAHRALRPKGPAQAQPRDIICRIHYYKVKEEILQKARKREALDFDGHAIQIFQDLSWQTLQKRRQLRPLTEALRQRKIKYRWGFPFNIQADNVGKAAVLYTPDDLPHFCETLGLPLIPLPDWSTYMTTSDTTSPHVNWQPSRRQKRKPQSSPRPDPGQST